MQIQKISIYPNKFSLNNSQQSDATNLISFGKSFAQVLGAGIDKSAMGKKPPKDFWYKQNILGKIVLSKNKGKGVEITYDKKAIQKVVGAENASELEAIEAVFQDWSRNFAVKAYEVFQARKSSFFGFKFNPETLVNGQADKVLQINSRFSTTGRFINVNVNDNREGEMMASGVAFADTAAGKTPKEALVQALKNYTSQRIVNSKWG